MMALEHLWCAVATETAAVTVDEHSKKFLQPAGASRRPRSSGGDPLTDEAAEVTMSSTPRGQLDKALRAILDRDWWWNPDSGLHWNARSGRRRSYADS